MSNENGPESVLVLAALCSLALCACVQAAPRPPITVPIPGGITDTGSEIGYVEGPSKDIEAISLKTGELVWKTKEASIPLLVARGRLLALAPNPRHSNEAAIVVLDPKESGAVRLRSEPLPFPEWVRIEPALGFSFSATAKASGNNVLFRWEAHARYAGGAPPSPEIEKRARKHASGIVRIDLESGRATTLPESDFPPPKRRPPGDLASITSQPYRVKGDWSTKPLVAGDKVVALTTKEGGGEEKLLLRRWDSKTGKLLATIKVADGANVVPQVTLDGQHLFLQREGTREEKAPRGWLVSLDTGERIGSINAATAVQEVSVVGQRAYFAAAKGGRPLKPGQPVVRMLMAADLKSGDVLWQHRIIGAPPSYPRP